MSELKVNDGNGLLDNIGMIDSLIVDCNELPQLLMSGRYVAFCGKIVEMVQKLSNLKKGVNNDTKFLQDEISELKKTNQEMADRLFEAENKGKAGNVNGKGDRVPV